MPDEKRQCCCSRGRDGSCGKQDKSCGGCSGGNRPGADCSGGCHDRTIYVTEDEKVLLLKLSQIPFLPLARFVTRDAESGELTSVAQAPVYMEDKNDTAETVRKTGDVLLSLEDKYLITLDYDLPLQNGDYALYESSALYGQFRASAAECSGIPDLERGSMALTTLGQDALDSIE